MAPPKPRKPNPPRKTSRPAEGSRTNKEPSAPRKHDPHKSGKHKQPALPTPLITSAGGTPSVLSGWSSNPSSSTKELHITYTDYFDTTGLIDFAYQQFVFDPSFSPMISQSDTVSPFNLCKVTSVKLYALPRFNVDTSASSVLFVFGLPVISGDLDTCAAQQSTLLTPTTTSKWVVVGSWTANKIFKDSNVTPALDNKGNTALGSWVLLDPDTLSPSTKVVQCRIEFKVSQTIPQVTQASYSIPTSDDASVWSKILTATPVVQDILAQVTGAGSSL